MNNAHTQKRLTWAIIFAQVFILVFGHGRVILCHEASGSSHIEFFETESCSSTDQDGCTQNSSNQNNQSVSCSGSSCVDELFQVNATLSTSRRFDFSIDQEFRPPFPQLFSWWLNLPDSTELAVVADFDDPLLFAEQQRIIRSTVLVL